MKSWERDAYKCILCGEGLTPVINTYCNDCIDYEDDEERESEDEE